MVKKGLGRGLSALLSVYEDDEVVEEVSTETKKVEVKGLNEVNIKDINFNGTKEGTDEDTEDDEEAGW